MGSCGILRVGDAIRCRLNMDKGILVVTPVDTCNAPCGEDVEWTDQGNGSQAQIPGVGKLRGQQWVPCVRTRGGKHGRVGVRFGSLSFVPPDPIEIEQAAAMAKAADVGDLK